MITKRIVVVLMVVMFFVGIAVLVYPHYQGAKIEDEMESEAISFLESVRTEPTETIQSDPDSPVETEIIQERQYPMLWDAMNSYNHTIYTDKQPIKSS